MRSEFAKGRLQRTVTYFFKQRLGAAAVFDQIGNGANFQAMRGGKHLQIRQARHGAVVIHDLANHPRRRAASHRRQVAARFGMAGAHQHTAINGLQRKDVAGLHQVADLRVLGDGCLHGTGTVGG